VCKKDGSLIIKNASETGSGTVLSLAVIALSVACFGMTQTVALHLLTGARLTAIAESAALSADDALRGLIVGYPCEIAREIASENMVILDECRIVGFEAFVKMHVDSMGIVLNATARAGPSS
jgi:secretion/DNA translocation related TadE-like protein